MVLVAVLSVGWITGQAQWWDHGSDLPGRVSNHTEGKLKVSFEFRTRYEDRTGVSFGKDPEQSPLLIRTRLGISYRPYSWIRFSGMVQDARAPLWGENAPSSVRDHADLHEGYFELFPDRKEGFHLIAGRQMLNYGEGRLLGTPQWNNLSRTYDNARTGYRLHFAQFEFLIASPVKIRIGEFNRPVLGERLWGSYTTFPNVFRKTLLEVYVLRRDQNRAGGFTGGSTRDGAWHSAISRRWTVTGKPFDLCGEYKYASSTGNPKDPSREGTFDQLYPSNHDCFGHQDLFGWRKLHNLRVFGSWGVLKNLSVNGVYSDFWLASARDALYNSSGKSIVRSATGLDGRHVGQEADAFVTYKFHHYTFGSGYGRFFNGQFIQRTTPHMSPNYVYIFQTYTL